MSDLHLPKEWQIVMWSDLTSNDGFKRGPFGGSLKKECFVNKGYAVYEQYAPINDDCTRFRYFIQEDKFNELAGFSVNEGDFLISCSGTIGRITQVPVGAPKGIINQALLRIRLVKGKIDSDYFIKLFRSPSVQSQILNKTVGGTIQNLAAVKELKEIHLPLPPLAEQKIIADKLDTLLAQVESIKARLERIPEILKQFRQSVLAAAVSGKLTEEWRRNNHTSAQQELNDLVNREYLYLQHKVKDQKSKTLKEKVELRGAGTKQSYKHDFPASWVFKPFFEFCLLNRGFDLPSSARTEGQYPILSAGGVSGTHVEYMVEGPCVTVGRSGSVGQVFFSEGRCWPLNTVLYVKDYGFSDPKYVYYKLTHMNLAQYASSTAVPTLNRNEFIQKLVAIPSSAEQKEIVHIVEHLFEVSSSIEKQAQSALDRINNLTQSILAKAFRGELTAEWREAHSELISGENSAEALLESIKAERSIKPVTKRSRGKA